MCVMFVAMIGSIQKPNAIFEIIFQMVDRLNNNLTDIHLLFFTS